MGLPIASSEQSSIIDDLKENNVVVDSVAGSGKTTTNLHIAKHFSDHNILLLTYNARLKFETRDRIMKENIENLEAHSYHSFCVNYYNPRAYTDAPIKTLVDKDKKPIVEIEKYDIIVVDEAQDITPLFYKLVKKIYKDFAPGAKICIFGDKNQSIYQFKDADSRYITQAPKLFNLNEIPWKECKLSTSFRITNEMASFVNNCLQVDRMVAVKSGSKPRYIIANSFSARHAFDEVKRYLLNYSPDEIFILAPSVKVSVKSPIKILENKLKNNLNLPIYIPISDEEKMSKEVIENKLVFSTFHQAKGLERKVVIILNFDDSYFKYFAKDADETMCPNTLYVACTRAIEHLTLFHHYKNDFMPFINQQALAPYVINKSLLEVGGKELKSVNLSTSVIELTSYLPTEVIENCLKSLIITPITPEDEIIDIPVTSEQPMGYESVSELTGIAIPLYFEFIKKSSMGIFSKLQKEDLEICQALEKDLSPANLLKIVNIWFSIKTGYIFKRSQIENYDWISEENLISCIERLENLDIEDPEIESLCIVENEPELQCRKLNGYFDCITNDKLFEFKCIEAFSSEHYLQLGLYMYMDKVTNPGKKRKYYIYNILTDELKSMEPKSEASLKDMIRYLIKNKYEKTKEVNDKDFISMNLENKVQERNNIKIFLDIETNGLPKRVSGKLPAPSKYAEYDECRVIELGYIVTNGREIIKKVNHIIKPNGFSITNDSIHGITEEMAYENGVDIDLVLSELLKDCEHADALVCHNIVFDKSILLAELYRNRNKDLNKFKKLDEICTMRLGARKMKKGLYIKMDKLYEMLFDKKIDQNHRALSDAEICMECYFEMNKN